MGEARERLRGLPPYALRRAVGRDELGVLRLQVAELALETVVLLVGDLGPVEDVVEPLVAADLVAKTLDAVGGRLGCQ